MSLENAAFLFSRYLLKPFPSLPLTSLYCASGNTLGKEAERLALALQISVDQSEVYLPRDPFLENPSATILNLS